VAGDNNNLSNEEPLSVNELAIRLKQRIKGHKGGIAGVWRQIDNRFKQEKIKSIEGIKVPGEKKIDYDTFRKAVYRLGSNEDSSKLEDMKFNINGNPLLFINECF
jgi:pyrimidine operon attenuation protein/uracil phosphoribosyltransferase